MLERRRLDMAEQRPRHLSVPPTMRAAAIDRFGGPEVLTIHHLPVPVPDPREVLIAVHTAGVGSWDAEMRAGWWPGGQPRFPVVLGTDGSGTIAEMGANVRRFDIDDRVYAYSFDNPKGGFYAEYVAVATEKVASIPDGLDLKRAGAVGTTGLTALQGIDDALHVRKGEAVIIHGASGGVGTLAVQFAKLRGARVFATASGDEGVRLARRLGAVASLDGKRDDVVVAAHRFAPNGVDGILATAGGKPLDGLLDVVRSGGRLAYPNGVEPEPKRRPGIKIIPYDATPGVREFQRLNRAIEAVKLKVPIAAQFPLEEAAKAHERLAAGHVVGKIVLRVR
jgi:NADPH:quinone reductase